ncbi:MAG TPA: hypothetical protein PLP44_10130 [Methylophilus sp.]|nr:hypothetical protein [Methylophilus sp.]
MLKPALTSLMQHICAQNNWAKPYLITYAGKTLCMDFSIMKMPLQVLEDGSLSVAGETALADATVHIPPSLAIRLLAKDEAARQQIRIEGDTHLAADFAKVIQHMRWDAAEDVSRIIGDIPAQKISDFSQHSVKEIKHQLTNLAEMLAEYWQEEIPVLAKKRQVETFNASVDTLVSDVDRLEKRADKLSQKLQQESPR